MVGCVLGAYPQHLSSRRLTVFVTLSQFRTHMRFSLNELSGMLEK